MFDGIKNIVIRWVFGRATGGAADLQNKNVELMAELIVVSPFYLVMGVAPLRALHMSGGRRGGRSSDPKKESGLPKRENKERRRVTSSGPRAPTEARGARPSRSRAVRSRPGEGASSASLHRVSDGASKPARGPKRGEDFGRVKAGASRKPDAFGAKAAGGKFAGGKAAGGGKFGDKAGKASRGDDAREDFVPRPRGKFAGYPVGGASKDKAPPRGPKARAQRVRSKLAQARTLRV